MAKTKEIKRLYRSETDRVVGGVAAGLAEYFEIDPVLVRLIFVIATIWGGFGFMLYLILWLIIPTESAVASPTEKTVEANAKEIGHTARNFGTRMHKSINPERSRQWLGIALVILGVWFVLGNFHIITWHLEQFWPAALIILGIILLARRS